MYVETLPATSLFFGQNFFLDIYNYNPAKQPSGKIRIEGLIDQGIPVGGKIKISK
jgi:hypothetical protein